MKPPYRVPLLGEVHAVPWNGYNVISTFSGGGGSSCGYRIAGYRILLASEFVESARETYRANFPRTEIDTLDIRKVRPEEWLERLSMRAGELDILDGSPPCASFSTVGKRERAWGTVGTYSDTEQRTDDLFFEFARILRGIRPKVFVAENVSGLVKGTAKGYFQRIIRELKESGYNVKAKLLDAQWLGVPQARQRLIFVGVRDDLGLQPQFPFPLPYRYSIADALGPSLVVGPVEKDADISRYAIGREWLQLRPGGQSKRYFQLVRPDPRRACPTITAAGGNGSIASVTHPTEQRKFSIAEMRRICSFPDDYKLGGSYAEQWERCGRAVPPVMMYHIAKAIRERILDNL